MWMSPLVALARPLGHPDRPKRMKRVRIGRVTLGQLPLGQWRYLGPAERF